jgi:hypothetical protein
MEGMMERTRGQGGVYEGVLSLHSGWQIEQKKKYKKKKGCLRRLLFDILHVTTNQKHLGVTEGEWDRMPNRGVTLGERNSIVLGLLSMSKHDPSKYVKEGNIANDNNE